MTDIKLLKDRIIFDGHSDTREECETITLMCDNLAKSKDFKVVEYKDGYAEFERIGNAKDLKFAPYSFKHYSGAEAQEKAVDLAMASGNQVVTPDSGKTLSKVTVNKPATLLPENIKKDVVIGGVTGTLESGGGSSVNIGSSSVVLLLPDDNVANGYLTGSITVRWSKKQTEYSHTFNIGELSGTVIYNIDGGISQWLTPYWSVTADNYGLEPYVDISANAVYAYNSPVSKKSRGSTSTSSKTMLMSTYDWFSPAPLIFMFDIYDND